MSSLPEGKEYVTANFQITLNSTDSASAVMFNPQYFRFDIAGIQRRVGWVIIRKTALKWKTYR